MEKITNWFTTCYYTEDATLKIKLINTGNKKIQSKCKNRKILPQIFGIR